MNEGDAAIAAARALIARDEKIERLEAELADEKAKKKAHAIEVRRLREKVTALLAELAEMRENSDEQDQIIAKLAGQVADADQRLAEWQRHGVRVTEDCETCDESGYMIEWIGAHPNLTDIPCPDCGGTGKELRDGFVEKLRHETQQWFGIEMADEIEDLARVIAEWLEAPDGR